MAVRVGVITGRTVKTNKDGKNPRLLLQVQMSNKDDVQTVEYVPQPGQDENPTNGSKVFIIQISESYKIAIGVDDGIEPGAATGEKWLYSLDDDGVVQALMKLLKSGIIEVNGNSDFAVRFAALDTALQLLVTQINAVLATKADASGAAGGLTLDISAAKVNGVKLP